MNGDELLSVRFYERELELGYQSEQEGRPMYRMTDYVRIEVPGNQLSVIDTIANEDHKRRFPVQWAHYQNCKAGQDNAPLEGTLMREWPMVNAAQVRELAYHSFYTVEQVANASDLQLQSIRMLAGMSPIAFRERARAYIAKAKDSAAVQHQAEELVKRDQIIQAQGDRLRSMEEMLQRLTDKIEGRAPAAEDAAGDPPAPRRGRPRSQEARA